MAARIPRGRRGGAVKYTEENFVGRVFNRLTVVAYNKRLEGRHHWVCKCSCGREKITSASFLIAGRVKSCGCLLIDNGKNQKNRRTHGLAHTDIYWSWQNMKARCLRKNHKQYYTYGKRGITITPKWLSFAGFLDDMGASWTVGSSIERKDVNKGYCKDNCCWIPKNRQSYNTTKTHWVCWKGKVMCAADAAVLSGVVYGTLINRIKANCPPHLLFLEPHNGRAHRAIG